MSKIQDNIFLELFEPKADLRAIIYKILRIVFMTSILMFYYIWNASILSIAIIKSMAQNFMVSNGQCNNKY